MKHTTPTFIGNPYKCQPDFPQQKWLVVKNDELKKKSTFYNDMSLYEE